MAWGDDVLKIALANPDVRIPAESSQKRHKKDLSHVLPQGSKLEIKFIQIWQGLNGPELKREVKFCARKWRFDFAHVQSKTAIEIEGGTRGKSRHTTHAGYKSDCEKYTEANKLGYVVFRLTYDMITVSKLQEIIDWIGENYV